jgi:nucleoside-diphosphate-sugar epimerase
MLLDEIRAGNITAQIARSADFYGPSAKTGVANILVFDKLAAGAKPVWLANAGVPHSFTWTPDAARGLVCLMDSDAAWNQTWHLPTAPDPPTGRQFIAMAAKEFGKSPDYRMLPKVMIKVVGWFDPTVRELYEMLYQNQFPYLFDYSKFAKAFGLRATTYPEGIRQAACHK